MKEKELGLPESSEFLGESEVADGIIRQINEFTHTVDKCLEDSLDKSKDYSGGSRVIKKFNDGTEVQYLYHNGEVVSDIVHIAFEFGSYDIKVYPRTAYADFGIELGEEL